MPRFLASSSPPEKHQACVNDNVNAEAEVDVDVGVNAMSTLSADADVNVDVEAADGRIIGSGFLFSVFLLLFFFACFL